jgi:hypothetical protein
MKYESIFYELCWCALLHNEANQTVLTNLVYEIRLPIFSVNRGTVSEEINKRIMIGNKTCYANSQLLNSALLSRTTKMKLYRTLIRPVVTYAAETRTLNISDENALRIFERRAIRKIYGSVCEDGVWRVRSNSEINSLLQGGDIVRRKIP